MIDGLYDSGLYVLTNVASPHAPSHVIDALWAIIACLPSDSIDNNLNRPSKY